MLFFCLQVFCHSLPRSCPAIAVSLSTSSLWVGWNKQTNKTNVKLVLVDEEKVHLERCSVMVQCVVCYYCNLHSSQVCEVLVWQIAVLSYYYFFHDRYSFAIVGINITGLAVSLLTGGHLKTHFYNVVEGKPRLEHFHQVYCKLTLLLISRPVASQWCYQWKPESKGLVIITRLADWVG